METFLSLIGFLASVFFLGFLGIKFIDAIFFFREFRDTTKRLLERIDENLRNHKP
jgi:hypothetical protein